MSEALEPGKEVENWKAPETGGDQQSALKNERDVFLDQKLQVVRDKNPDASGASLNEARENWGRIYDLARNSSVEKAQLKNHQQFAERYEATANDPTFSEEVRRDAAREAAYRRREIASLERDISANELRNQATERVRSAPEFHTAQPHPPEPRPNNNPTSADVSSGKKLYEAANKRWAANREDNTSFETPIPVPEPPRAESVIESQATETEEIPVDHASDQIDTQSDALPPSSEEAPPATEIVEESVAVSPQVENENEADPVVGSQPEAETTPDTTSPPEPEPERPQRSPETPTDPKAALEYSSARSADQLSSLIGVMRGIDGRGTPMNREGMAQLSAAQEILLRYSRSPGKDTRELTLALDSLDRALGQSLDQARVGGGNVQFSGETPRALLYLANTLNEYGHELRKTVIWALENEADTGNRAEIERSYNSFRSRLEGQVNYLYRKSAMARELTEGRSF